MRQPQKVALSFPTKGIDVNWAMGKQPPGSTFECLNVRAYDVDEDRQRGGQRPGLSKYCSAQAPDGAYRVQNINQLVTASSAAASQTNVGVRTVTNYAVANGDIYHFTTSAATLCTNGNATLVAASPVIFSAALFDTLYYADITAPKKVTGTTVSSWVAVSGTFPTSGGKYPRLICQWRGRIVMSGLQGDPHNWFMSKKDDATDWDYSPTPQTEAQAVAGSNAEAGYIGQQINSLVPYSDDLLIFGADHSIWQMTGDPMAGGRLDLITDITGMSWGEPWCKSPSGILYFWGSRGGLYAMAPGQKPQRISAARVEKLFSAVNLDTTLVRLAWNDVTPGVHIFLTPLTAGHTINYFYDARSESFWPEQFENHNHNPVSVYMTDGDSPNDRVMLLGGQDGYIRRYDDSQAKDDGRAMQSYVYLGPIQVEGEKLPFVLSEIQAVLGRHSSNIGYRVYCGDSAEQATDPEGCFTLVEGVNRLKLTDGNHLVMSATTGTLEEVTSGFLSGIRSDVHNIRGRAYVVWIKIYNYNEASDWELDHLKANINVIVSSKGRKL